ncbi:MAG: threonine aldolase family protein [Candidatus Nanopelagicales bacterium]
MISFASDNYAPAHPKVLEKLQQVNIGHVPAYGADQYTKTAIELIQNSLGAPKAEVFFVFNGTGANVVSISNVVNSWNSIICAETAHINVDEGGAPEKIMGTKLVDLKTEDGKLTPELIAPIFVRMGDQHTSQPNLISITQSTEMGTVYTTDEIKALADFAHQHEAFLHVDGARISNAAVSLNKKFDEIITKTNVDFLSFGGTKNGLLGAEAVVILNPNLAKNTPWIRKSSMQLASKHRYLSAQFLAFFEEDLWKQNASHANQMASKLRSSIENNSKITLTQKTQANAVFAILDPKDIEKLQKEFHFYVWNSNTNEVRWMCSWDTEPAAVESFASAINSL